MILQLHASAPSDVPVKPSHGILGFGADPSDGKLPAGPYDLFPLLSTGDSLPGTPNLVIERIISPAVNDAGQVGLALELNDRTTSERDFIFDLFVHDSNGLNRIAGTAGVKGDGDFALNQNGTMAFRVEDSLIVADSERVLYRIQPGDPTPVPSASEGGVTLGRLHTRERFFNDRDETVFVSELSDGRSGLFQADLDSIEAMAIELERIPGLAGQLYPMGSLERAEGVLVDGLLVVLLNHGIDGILLFTESGVVPLAFEGDRILPGLTVRTLKLLDADDAGRILLVVNSEHLLLWTGTTFERLLGPGTVLPGLPGPSHKISSGYIMSEDAVFFTLLREPLGGIFLWKCSQIHKIAVDGDPSPMGDRLQLTFSNSPFPGHGGRLLYPFPRPASTAEAVFEARIPERPFRVPMVWQRGTLLPIDLSLEPVSKDPAGLLQGLTPLGTDATGSILLRGNLCCQHESLFWARPASPRTSYIPFLAHGTAGTLRYQSTLEMLNTSHFPALVRVEFFSAAGTQLQASTDEFLIPVEGTSTVSVQEPELSTGYAKLTVENGATLLPSLKLRIFEGDSLLGRSVISAEVPATQWDLIVDVSSGSPLPLSLTNPNRAPLTFELELRDREGVVVDQAEMRVDEGRQASFYVSTIFPLLASGDFSGRLSLRSGRPFLIAAFSQLGLKLFPVPLFSEAEPSPQWGFKTRFPLERSGERFGLVRANRQGTIAFTVEAEDIPTQLWVLTPQDSQQLLPVSSFPPSTPGFPYQDAQVAAVNEAGQVLFALQRAEDQISELFLFRDGEQRKIYEWEGGFTTPIGAALSPSGLVALRGEQLVLIDAGAQVLVRSTDLLPDGSGDVWGRIEVTSFNRNSDLVFATPRGAGLFADGKVRLLTRTDQFPGVPDNPVDILDARLNDSGQTFFRAAWKEDVLTTKIGLFVHHEGQTRSAVLPGDVLPDSADISVVQVGSFQLDSEGRAVAAVWVQEEESREYIVFLRVPADTGAAETLLRLDSQPGISEIYGFDVAPDGSLLIHASEGEPQSVWLWSSGVLRKVLGGDLPGESSITPAFVRRVNPVKMLESGQMVLDLEAEGGRGDGIYLGQLRYTRKYLPLIVQGTFGPSSYGSRLLLSNPSPQESTVRIQPMAPDGAQTTPTEVVTLAAGATRAVEFDQTPGLLGWAQLESEGAIQALLRITQAQDGSIGSEIFTKASILRHRATLRGHLSRKEDTALSLVNPYPRTMTVELELTGRRGSVTRELVISAGGQSTWLSSQEFLQGSPPLRTIRLRSGLPFPILPLQLEGFSPVVAPLR